MNNKPKRNCPECNIDIFYSGVSGRNQANRKNSLCGSCARSGKRNNMYGKTHTDCVKKAQSNRMIKNNPSKNIDYSAVDVTGENNPKVKKILKERNITYDEYLNSKSDWDVYKSKVQKITNKQPLYLLKDFDKKRGLLGVKNAYQLDHIIPVKFGFDNNISPEIIGDMSNLRFISWKDNINKSDKLINDENNYYNNLNHNKSDMDIAMKVLKVSKKMIQTGNEDLFYGWFRRITNV